ncbi:MAG TPA: TatD family hydrolase [Acidimicrobiales bacterium]|nr:TatD family hydrolase [Acidimicrobiales bacterium]
MDSHCHLQDGYLGEGEQLAEVLGRAADAGVGGLVCIGTDLVASRHASELALAVAGLGAAGVPGRQVRVWATVGLHPHEAKEGTEPVAALLEELLATSPVPRGAPGSVVGVGECGLDYHYDHSPRDVQREAFAAQIALAKRHDLTLVVHTREAWDDTFDLLGAGDLPARTIIHCFTGGPDEARRCVELGAFVSFSGIVTFKNATGVREAAVLCPPDRLLVETDAPFLAPVPHRGRPNEPAYVTAVGEAIAALRGMPAAELAALTSDNAARAFALAG